jgi:hypothetical protein
VANKFLRVVTTPDILFSAADMSGVPDSVPVVNAISRSVIFNAANRLPGLAGPGTIDPPSIITFNKVGDLFEQGILGTTNAFLSEASQSSQLAWGSFDGTTNDPVVYPNGTSIENLENLIVIQITLIDVLTGTTLSSVPDGTNGAPYPSLTFMASGGAFNYSSFSWSALGLPSGLTVTSGGTLSGTPTQSGTFDFTLLFTDAIGRTVQWTYPVTIQ